MKKNMQIKAKANSIKSFVRGVIDGTLNVPDKAIIYHLTDEKMMETITKKRLELLRTIKTRRPSSIKELAALVKRTKQAVDRDLKILEKNELVSLKKEGKTAMPHLERELIVFSLSGSATLEA